MIKRGYTTTEFWTALVGQLLALLTILGIVQSADAATLQDALGKGIAAVFVLIANAWVVVRYIQGRTELKQAAVRSSNGSAPVVLPGLALAAFAWMALPVQAAPPPRAPARVPACLFRIEQRQSPRDDTALLVMMQQVIGLQQQSLANQQLILALLHQQRPLTPPPPPHGAAPIIIEHRYAPPLPELPIAGRPRQELPIEGKPKQELPEAGKPKQELPEAGRPRQELPESAKPRQELPQAAPPKQELPLMPPATQALPMQRFTVVRALWRR